MAIVVGLTVAMTACSYAPLPDATGAGGSAAPSTTSSGLGTVAASAVVSADDPGSVIPDVVGGVCCVVSASTTPSAINGISTTYNGWDTSFITWMIPHYAVAAQEAELAPTRAKSAQVKALALAIDGEQGTTYLKMAAMAGAWSQPVPSTDPNAASGHDHGGGSTTGLDDAQTLAKLSGAKFDQKFLKIAIADDQAALLIAKATIENCVNPQAKQLAQEIDTSVTAQVSQMQQLLETAS